MATTAASPGLLISPAARDRKFYTGIAPRRQAPHPHVSGRYREHDANEGVPDTKEKDRTDPRLTR